MNESKAKNDLVYQALKSDILNGNYPPDHHLDREHLCKKYGFSTTPTNIALVRLSNEGLLDKRGRDGFYTRKLIAINELKEIYLCTGAVLKLSAREFLSECPDVPLRFHLDAEKDVLARTEQFFERVGGLLGPNMFHAIIRASNDRLHLIRKNKAGLISDPDKEITQLVQALEGRNLKAWSELVDAYVGRRLSLLPQLTQLLNHSYRAD